MTGSEFQQAMKQLGFTQVSLASRLGCNRDTIAARCKADVVDEPYRLIMLGLLTEKAAHDLVAAVQRTR